MIGNNQICYMCSMNSVTDACLCDGDIKVLCKSCISQHLSDTYVTHDILEVELGLRMRSNPSLLAKYLEDNVKVSEILSKLKLYTNKLKLYKQHLDDSKDQLYTEIEKIFARSQAEIIEIEQQIKYVIKVISDFKRNLCEEGQNLIEAFKLEGVNTFLQQFPQEFCEIPVNSILEFIHKSVSKEESETPGGTTLQDEDTIDKDIQQISHSINLLAQTNLIILEELQQTQIKIQPDKLLEQKETPKPTVFSSSIQQNCTKLSQDSISSALSPRERVQHHTKNSGRRYIYTTGKGTRYLFQYDIPAKKVNLISLPSMRRNFHATSTCELPNGDVFMAGFYNPVSGEVYLYKVSTQEVIRLPSLLYPRYFFTLFYHENYIYAFGGYDCNELLSKSHRFNLNTESWERLPNMKYCRSSVSCVSIGHKIYLFHGGDKTIECFNTLSMEFSDVILDNSESSNCESGVASILNDRVYLLTDNLLQVFDTSLTKLLQIPSESSHVHHSLNSAIVIKNTLYFYNYHTFSIEKLSGLIESFPKKQSIYHYQRHINDRYIYKARDNFKELHRVDLKHKTIQTLDLSSVLSRDFSLTSVCILPSGEVFIAGFDDPVSGECFIYNPSNGVCIKMPELRLRRYWVSLICYNKYVYAFGGRDESRNTSRAGERFDLMTRCWQSIGNMITGRNTASCVGIMNRIYIFGGGEKDVEIYDIDRNEYSMSSVVLFSKYVMAAVVDEMVYVIGDTYYKVFQKNLEPVQECQDRWNHKYFYYSSGNVVCYKDKLCFFNDWRSVIEKVNVKSFERGILITHI